MATFPAQTVGGSALTGQKPFVQKQSEADIRFQIGNSRTDLKKAVMDLLE